ncbi:MAG TPA: ATP-binding cassette domain-containing protein [Bryobacteraceae bacterium]
MPSARLDPRPTDFADSRPAAELLRFDHVTVRFDGKTALDDVSFHVNPGETLVLYGAAGSGKTVLLKTAVGLVRPDGGDVNLFGRNITPLREEQLFPLRHRVGVLFQEGGLFDSLTIAENVEYPLLNGAEGSLPEEEARARAKQAVDFVELGSTLEQFPSELSGGMRRRIGIARASVTRPPLILYDSPTAGLDPITAYRIMALVIRQRDTRNTTALVVTHRHQDGLLLAHYRYDPQTNGIHRTTGGRPTRFLVLREGHIAFEGPLDELNASKDPYVASFVGKNLPSSGGDGKDLHRLSELLHPLPAEG